MKTRATPPVLAGLLLLASVASTSACKGSAAQEATALVAAVDNFRRADNAYKPAAAKAVGAVACSADDVCAAKAACLTAIGPMVDGIALDDDVKKGLDAIRSTEPPDPTLAVPLGLKAKQARALLEQGHAAMKACDEKTLALQAKYQLLSASEAPANAPSAGN